MGLNLHETLVEQCCHVYFLLGTKSPAAKNPMVTEESTGPVDYRADESKLTRGLMFNTSRVCICRSDPRRVTQIMGLAFAMRQCTVADKSLLSRLRLQALRIYA